MFMSDSRITDQASGLRRMTEPRPIRVISIASGKGGVGKTNISVNLAVAMAQSGKEVLLMDADMGLANVDVLLGLRPAYNLSHVMKGERTLEEVIVAGPAGVQIIPASSGYREMSNMNEAECAGLIRAFSELSNNLDVLIIDNAAGIAESVTSFSRAAQEVIVVVCNEPASITDAYALIKVLNTEYGVQRFHILPNMAPSIQEGRELFDKLTKVTDRFLDVTLDFMGYIPYDDQLKKAVQKQEAVVSSFSRSKSATAFKNLVKKTDSWPMPSSAGGHLEFFVERLIQASHNNIMASL